MTAAVRSAAASGPVGLRPAIGVDHGPALGRRPGRPRRGHSSSISGRRDPNPVSSSCQNATSDSPSCQHSHTWRPPVRAGKSIKPAFDVAQRDPERIDPRDRRGHLVDDPLHPEADPLGLLAVVRGGPAARRRGVRRQRPIAQPDQLGALVGQRGEQRADLDQGLVGGVDVEEAGHRRVILARRAREGPPTRDGRAYHRRRKREEHDTMDLGLDGARALDRRRLGRAGRRDRGGPDRRRRARRARRPAVGSARGRRRTASPVPSRSTPTSRRRTARAAPSIGRSPRSAASTSCS